MKAYQTEFIELALRAEALSFGTFELKSGRISPYFFNAGKFQSGAAIANLGRYYAQAIIDSGIEFDMLFGPAYKGIPLSAVTAASLYDQHGIDAPYCYNRKEAKAHGEGGTLVGATPSGRVLIIDDVITAGTAVREVLSTLNDIGAKPAAIVIGLNRQERGTGSKSAIDELIEETGVQVISIVDLEHIMQFLSVKGDDDTLQRVEAYRLKYGTQD